jgi:hypothetical protein
MKENKETKEILMCENCGEMFCHDISIGGPCIPILINEKEKRNERNIIQEHNKSVRL